ncbi:MAG: hypothetical protein ACK5UC_26950 [Planctomycetaceae bacterium]|jgi:hypothetical protein
MPPSENVLVSFLFGGGLVLAAVLFARHTTTAGGIGRLPTAQPLHAFRRATRRQSAIVGLLLALGGLIPLGDLWLTWHRDPRWFAVYVLVILGLSLWLLGLGVCEALAVLAMASHRDRSHPRKSPLGD